MRNVYYTLLALILLPSLALAQRELKARPVSPIPMVHDLFKHPVDPSAEWVKVDVVDVPTNTEFNTFNLHGQYTTFPFLTDKGRYPSLILACTGGKLYSAILRVHNSYEMDQEELDLMLRTDRKNVFFKVKPLHLNRLDYSGGPDRVATVNYTQFDIAPLLVYIKKSSTAMFYGKGMAIRFDLPVRPVGIESACGIKY